MRLERRTRWAYLALFVGTCSAGVFHGKLGIAHEGKSAIAATTSAERGGMPGPAVQRGPHATHAQLELAPIVDVSAVNPGATVERDLCLTLRVGADAASECADLRLVHPLPSVRTMNRTRTPVLLYNSQHAEPHPIVGADVTLPSGTSGLQSVTGTLRVNGQTRAQTTWAATGWPAGGTARVALGYDAPRDRTGIYSYTLEIDAVYGSGTYSSTVSGSLAVVNRRCSPFGCGWWLAGLERLVVDPTGASHLWIGGDGSVRQYQQVAADRWVAPSVDRPDTLMRENSGEYVRLLPGGVRVRFDSSGQHIATVNRLEYSTNFSYTSDHRLETMSLPAPPGVRRPTYRFLYRSGQLATIEAPDTGITPRLVRMYATGSRLDSIQDPDGTRVRFGYTGASRQITSRTDRRGITTSFGYEAKKLTSSTLVMASGEAITHTIRPLETQGLTAAVDTVAAYTLYNGPRGVEDGVQVGDTTQFWLDRFGAPRRISDPMGHRTLLVRDDSRFPALVTRIEYPRLLDGRQRVVTASYNARGNLKSRTEANPYDRSPAQDAITRFEYTDVNWPDFVTRLVPPSANESLPAGERMADSTIILYDARGSRWWQQTGDDPNRGVKFDYYPLGDSGSPGLPKSTTLPGGAREQISYDSRGNLSKVITPLGYRTVYENDGLGRTTRIWTPIESGDSLEQRHSYDLMDRDTLSVTVGDPSAEGSLVVRQKFDAEGNVIRVGRRSVGEVDPIGEIVDSMVYDAAGRLSVKFSPDSTPNSWTDNPRDTTRYDPAGNPVWVRARSRLATGPGQVLTMLYDPLNRLTERHVPSVVFPGELKGFPATLHSDQRCGDMPTQLGTIDDGLLIQCSGFPLLTLGQDLSISSDVETFEYDPAGNVREADNKDAHVTREYFTNGQLRTETQRIAAWDSLDFGLHAYRLDYQYDLDGRRTELKHPAQLLPTDGGVLFDHEHYAYDPVTGALAEIRDLFGNRFTYSYNLLGQLDTLQSDNLSQAFGYDDDGQLKSHRAMRLSVGGPVLLYDQTLAYDQRGKMRYSRNQTGTQEEFKASYTHLGYVQATTTSDSIVSGVGDPLSAHDSESFSYDAMGNILKSVTSSGLAIPRASHLRPEASQLHHTWNSSIYGAGTGRLLEKARGGENTTLSYDPAGDVVFEDTRSSYTSGAQTWLNRASYYGSDGRLRAVDLRQWPNDFSAAGASYEEYRYDALGRRVEVRTRQYCDEDSKNNNLTECNQSAITRTVWDGDQELYEIRMPGETGSPDLENDTAWVHRAWISSLANEGDPNPFFGRVGYLNGPGTDEPLSITRIHYVDLEFPGANLHYWPSFTFEPLWNARGQAINGSFPGGTPRWCHDPGGQYCVKLGLPAGWFSYARKDFYQNFWHGSILLDKRDGSGMLYRRNRYYDPGNGRFTQEDPIGLAGGVNLYGFAGGDPVSYGDPFGLCPTNAADGTLCIDLFIQAKSAWGFRGDNRAFDANADASRSRMQITFRPGDRTGTAITTGSCSPLGCYAPYKSNNVAITVGKGGSITVKYNAEDSAGYGFAPELNGTVTFNPDGQGGWKTFGNRDNYPNLGIYQRTNGAWNALQQRPGAQDVMGPARMAAPWPNDRW